MLSLNGGVDVGTSAPNSYTNANTANPDEEWNGREDAEFYGAPDGPIAIYPIVGEAGTFTQQRADMRLPKDSGTVWLMHHVPRNCRGKYKLTDRYVEEYNDWLDRLAEGDQGIPQFEVGPPEQWLEEERLLKDFRVDQHDWVLCDGTTKSGEECKRKAVNFAGYCEAHGGKLHPLDKVVDTRRAIETPKDSAYNNPEVQERMTRYQKFISGLISVKDLDDEELARGQFRDRKGGFSGNPPKQIPREMHDQFVTELFERADMRLREGLVECVNTMVEVATSPVYEAKDRLKAAQWVFERVRGKQADVVVHTQDKPWEHVFQGISGGSREDSRAARETLDAEFEDEGGVDSTTLAVVAQGGEVEWDALDDDDYDDAYGMANDGPPGDHDRDGVDGDNPVATNSRTAPSAKPTTEEDSQYEYSSISLVDDDGNDYDKVVAKPKKGSQAAEMADKRKAAEKRRKAALRALKAQQISEATEYGE